ncbi:MAG: hypothetical protein M0Z99_19170 [Betaproteobacteria bacterium]|nr:hypothetical protein [Betaproteobacteria bacterium]
MAAPETKPRMYKYRTSIALLALLMACSVHAEDCKEGDVMVGATRYKQVCLPVLLLPGEVPFQRFDKGRVVEMHIGNLSDIPELPKGAKVSPIPGTQLKPRPVN